MIIATSLYFYLNMHIEDILREQIELHKPEHIELKFEDISINVLNLSAGIDQVEVTAADSGALAWRVSAERLFIDNLSIITLLRGEGLQLDSLLISGMKVTFHKNLKPAENPNNQASLLKSRMPVKIEGFRISSGQFDYNPEGGAKATGSFHYLLSDFKRDSMAAIDVKSLYLNSVFKLRVDQMTSKDSLYTTYIHSIRKKQGDTLILDSLSFTPNQSLTSFTKHFGWNKAMLHLGISEIKASIDLDQFPDPIRVPFCSVDGAQLEVNKDKRWP
ncbi:MAG TPA: hypothetical protein VJ894_09040, partial [Cryomorphaceae bacterium]|nr:hypothetical protein [Cryomorphaceae bacterium]